MSHNIPARYFFDIPDTSCYKNPFRLLEKVVNDFNNRRIVCFAYDGITRQALPQLSQSVSSDETCSQVSVGSHVCKLYTKAHLTLGLDYGVLDSLSVLFLCLYVGLVLVRFTGLAR